MASRAFNVYGIGNAIVDLQLNAEDEDLRLLGLDKAAMKLADVTEQEQVLKHCASRCIHLASGGSAANSMIAVAQLGGSTAYGCLVGHDRYGEFYLKEMRALGVELQTTPLRDVTTGTCVILITPDAERTMVTHLGASACFSPVDVSEELLSQSEWLYVEGYLLSCAQGAAAAEKAVAAAKKAGVKVALGFSAGFIVQHFRAPLEKIVASADLIFANAEEAQLFTGEQDETLMLQRLFEAVPAGVVTLGERGSAVFFDGRICFVPAVRTQAVDLTGAGDMFAGAFLYGITHGLNGEEAGNLASFLSAEVVSQLGPRLQGDVRAKAVEKGFLT